MKNLKKRNIIWWTLTAVSNQPTPIPEAAPELAKPTKWLAPILLENKEAPTCNNYIKWYNI